MDDMILFVLGALLAIVLPGFYEKGDASFGKLVSLVNIYVFCGIVFMIIKMINEIMEISSRMCG